MRIVADTNTLVSGFGWGGAPGLVVDAILAGRLTLVISPPLRDELHDGPFGDYGQERRR